MTWNIACLGKYVWALLQNKIMYGFVRIHSVYIKGDKWWNYTPYTGASLYWKKLCQVKEKLKRPFTELELRIIHVYSIQSVHDKLKGEKETTIWDKVIWNMLSIPSIDS